MPDTSCFETLMDPTTRSMVHITEVGDPSTSYGIIGKKTVQYRKELMSATGSLSQQFRRTNDLFSDWLEVQ
jgi:Tfp pilus assembly PilM family ATPase